MRVLVLSHAAVVAGYRRKFELVAAAHPTVEITIVTPTAWAEGGRQVRAESAGGANWRLRPLPVVLGGRQFGHLYRGLGLVVREAQPDLIHLEEEPPSFVAWQVCRLRERLCPQAKLLFFTWENVDQRWGSWRALLYPRVERRVWRSATAAIAGTQMAKDLLRARGFDKPTFVLPQVGIDTQRFRRREVSELRERLLSSGVVIGYAGRLIPEKGVDDLLRAAKSLAGATTLIVGGGVSSQSEPRTPNVISIGAVSHADMPNYFNCMDIFVLPSRTTPTWAEQFGRVMLEAMACEVPVVASATGAIPEVVGDAALLFPEGEVDALRGCLRRLINDADWRRALARRGRARVLEKFSDEVIARRLWRIYASVWGRAA